MSQVITKQELRRALTKLSDQLGEPGRKIAGQIARKAKDDDDTETAGAAVPRPTKPPSNRQGASAEVPKNHSQHRGQSMTARTTQERRFAKGERVQLTEAALRQFRRGSSRFGTVVGFGRDLTTIRVLRDGTKTASSWAAAFWEAAQPDCIVTE